MQKTIVEKRGSLVHRVLRSFVDPLIRDEYIRVPGQRITNQQNYELNTALCRIANSANVVGPLPVRFFKSIE